MRMIRFGSFCCVICRWTDSRTDQRREGWRDRRTDGLNGEYWCYVFTLLRMRIVRQMKSLNTFFLRNNANMFLLQIFYVNRDLMQHFELFLKKKKAKFESNNGTSYTFIFITINLRYILRKHFIFCNASLKQFKNKC